MDYIYFNKVNKLITLFIFVLLIKEFTSTITPTTVTINHNGTLNNIKINHRTVRGLGVLKKYIRGISRYFPESEYRILQDVKPLNNYIRTETTSYYGRNPSTGYYEYEGHRPNPWRHHQGYEEPDEYEYVPVSQRPVRPNSQLQQGQVSKPIYFPSKVTTLTSTMIRRTTTTRRPVVATMLPAATTRRPPTNKPKRNASSLLEGPNCGLSSGEGGIQNRIIGGRETRESEFPWQVAITDKTSSVFCGGAVINRRWIITAAHCVVKLEDLGSIRGLVGANDLKDPGLIEIKFTKLISHQKYRSDTYENDIALLQTSDELPLYPSTKSINTICLPRETNFRGMGTIAGWGRTAEGGEETDALLAADVEIMPDERCKEFYKDRFKPGKQFCAGLEKGGRDSCQGDSGGPLIKEDGSRSYLIGIVSFGRGCGRRRSPGVYTKVSTYVDWIRSQI